MKIENAFFTGSFEELGISATTGKLVHMIRFTDNNTNNLYEEGICVGLSKEEVVNLITAIIKDRNTYEDAVLGIEMGLNPVKFMDW